MWGAGRALAASLAEAALRTEPALDPRPALRDLAARAVLVHGRTDRLVPFTETMRLREELPASVPVTSGITRLLAHSGDEEVGGGRGAHRRVRAVHAAARGGAGDALVAERVRESLPSI